MKRNDWLLFLVGILWITLATAAIYSKVLSHTNGLYPWASDGLSHVMKAAYVQEEFSQGVIYPEFFPYWYFGAQVLRYYPPLPYYAIVLLSALFQTSLIGGTSWLIALCAWIGGLSWLLYHRWIGWTAAIGGGTLFLFLPDNIRVAFAEGNYPRMVTTALIPLLIYFVLRIQEDDSPLWSQAGLIISMALVVLSHAMLAAIYAVTITIFVGILWLGKATTLRRASLVPASIAIGIMLSGWWLLPSFTGGITEMDTSYWSRITFPWSELLNPWLRQHNIEALYVGAVLMVLPIIAIILPKGRSAYTLALTATGAFGILINTSGFNALYNALPLSSLMMPYRFLGIASFTLLLALLWQVHAWESRYQWLLISVILLIALDNSPSLRLIRLSPPNQDVLNIAHRLATLPGWREATLDEGRLGPAPSYFFTEAGGREQIYGWSYYGARAATTISALEDAILYNKKQYVLDRLALFGTDDVVLLKSLDSAPAIASGLLSAGYDVAYESDKVALYHKDGLPRAAVIGQNILGIGRGARNFSYLYPQIIVGTSPNVDDYDLDTLTRYSTVVLSGFQWHDRLQAESLVQQAAKTGTTFIIDLTNSREDPVSRIPRFLGVWAEQIILPPEPIRAQGDGAEYALRPFGTQERLWHTHTPQGLQTKVVTYDYLGEEATMVGYNTYGEGHVWFIGANLPYHAVTTNDSEAIRMLSEILHLKVRASTSASPISLKNYRASHTGYQFEYSLPSSALLFVPVAYHEGMTISVDGAKIPPQSFENLLAFDAPAGHHRVEIRVHHTGIYQAGIGVSALAILAWMTLTGIQFFHKRRPHA